MTRVHNPHYFLKISSFLLCAGLPHSVRDVLATLHFYRNGETGQCNPSMERLAAELGLSIRTIQYAITWLRDAKIIAGRTKGHRIQSYQLAPESDWAKLIHLRKSCGSHLRNSCVTTYAKAAELPTQLLRSSAAVSITEKKKEKKKEEKESARVVRSVVANGNGAHAHAPLPSAQPLPEPTGTPSPEIRRMARPLLSRLVADHPKPGLPRKALEVLSGLLGASDAPESLAATITDHHRSWVGYWNATGGFVPFLWNWLGDGDWEFPPAEAQKKKPGKALSWAEKMLAGGKGD